MVFVSTVNPVTKKVEWIQEDDDEYGFEDEVSASMFGDMLHDTERNEKYKEAISRVIKSMPENTRVLDIGTGTGLLGLFSAEAGAGYVHGCELFEPMAEVARQTIKASPYKDRMDVVGKRSTDLTVGPGKDLPERASLVVAELLDTELIGEGCLPSYRDAKRRLLTPNAKSVPSGATMYCQLISSQRLWDGHKIPVLPGMERPLPPCPGTHQTQNIQANTYKDIVCYSEPFTAFEFDFMNVPPSDVEICKMTCKVPVIKTGKVQAVLYWWDLHLDESTHLNTAPDWALGRIGQWRDHWMQAVCFMPEEVEVEEGTEVEVAAAHDDFSLWYTVYPSYYQGEVVTTKPDCICDAHLAWNHSRIGMLNDRRRMDIITSAIYSVVKPDSVCLSLGDGSLPAMMAAFIHGCQNVYTVEDTAFQRRLLSTLLSSGEGRKDKEGRITVIGRTVEDLTAADLDGKEIDVLMAEPYFLAAVLPWQHIYFWYARERLAPLLSPSVKILPGKAILRAAAIATKELWKSHDNIDHVCDLNLQAFQNLLDRAGSTRGGIHTYQMSEYEYEYITNPFDLMIFDFTQPVSDLNYKVMMEIKESGMCDSILLWMDYELIPGHVVTTNPLNAPYMKQAVYMLTKPERITDETKPNTMLKCDTSFSMETGEVSFDFGFL